MTQVLFFLKFGRVPGIQPKTQSTAAPKVAPVFTLVACFGRTYAFTRRSNTLACCALLLSTLGCDSGSSSEQDSSLTKAPATTSRVTG